ILAVPLKKAGASFTGTSETILSGNPLNVSDIDVDRDGSIVFVTGGRSTRGGIYRLRAKGTASHAADASTIEQLLTLPQMQSAWAREIAAKVRAAAAGDWQKKLETAATSGAAETQLRALTLL